MSSSPLSHLGAGSASMSTFSGMQTREDWSTSEARQAERHEANQRGEEEDTIVQELPIVLSQQLAQTLYLMQSPLRPPHRPYDVELGERVALKVKPIQKKVEMEFTLEDAGVNYQADGGRLGDDPHQGNNYDHGHSYPIKKLTLQAKPVPPKTNYCAGVLSNGVLHLTPIHAICRFKPSLDYIDAADSAALAESEAKREAHRYERLREGRMTEEEELEMEEEEYQRVKEEENKKELQTVIMKVKKKEHAGNGAGGSTGPGGLGGAGPAGGVLRKQTYAFLKQIEEREEWIPLKVHETESPVTSAQFNRLLGSGQPQPIPFNVPAQHYLSYVNPPDVLEGNSSNMALIAAGDPLYLSFEDRIVYFMRNCRQVHFSEFCLKLQIVSEDQLELAMRELASICWVIQGCLVLKSSIVYDRNWRPGMVVPPATQAPATGAALTATIKQRGMADRVQMSREYILTQFQHSRIVYRDELNEVLQLELEPLEEILSELATKSQVDTNETRANGIPKGGRWEWKLESSTQLQQYFPKLVAHSDQQLPHIEAELRKVLSTSSSHPSRDGATRGLLLTHPENIVHGLAPAGLTQNRRKANQTSGATRFDPSSMPSSVLVPSLGDWRQHLHQLFAAHGILHDSFIQSEVRRLIDLAAVGGSHLALGDMEKVLQTEANTFGPEGKYWMETKKGQLASRSLAASLFASNSTISFTQIRSSLPRNLSDDKRREIMREFAIEQVETQTWQLRRGIP